jgi:hypothetical protein
MLKAPAAYDKDTSPTKLTDIFRQVSPALVIGISIGICQKALLD